MSRSVVLASASPIRGQILQSAGIAFSAIPARLDEDALTSGLLAEGAHPRDVADTLAEMKAQKIAQRHPEALVLGCDQVLALGTKMLSKPRSADHAVSQLAQMEGRTHQLFSALVLYDQCKPVWRHIGMAHMTMHPMNADGISHYVAENWDQIKDAVGCYKIEEAGRALFSAIDGDIATIQGLPITPLMQYLRLRGFVS